ncbi:MAG TPA: ADP-ribosylglycohydrolase family protein [Thermoanaerobaculia bacterium]|nr:ADP-ribosylglycohydrolase family protein [Thermoanaerobaculia bacterium]
MRSDLIQGGLYGLLVGDALGVPYEFQAASALPRFEEIEMEPPPGFARSHPRVPPGSWSDDGSQALCLLTSILYHGRLDLDDFGRRLLNWRNVGYLAAGGVVFDIGVQTSRALDALENGVPAEKAGPAGERDNGNGSLMRVLPLALWHRGTDAELFRDAARQSLVTHGHPRAQLCCALYCLWTRRTLEGNGDAWTAAVRTVRELCDPALRAELEEQIHPESEPGGAGSGYVVDCLHSARSALRETTFEAVVKRAVLFGNDTDTTAAVAGGIAGARFGLSSIPERWLDRLPDRQIVDSIAQQLVGAA